MSAKDNQAAFKLRKAQLDALSERMDKAHIAIDPAKFDATKGEFFVIIVGIVDSTHITRAIASNVKTEMLPAFCGAPSSDSIVGVHGYLGKNPETGEIERLPESEEAKILAEFKKNVQDAELNRAREGLANRLAGMFAHDTRNPDDVDGN